MSTRDRGCRCGKHMFEAFNDGTCVWCGYGPGPYPLQAGRRRRLGLLPRDLGALQREGRRPDLQLDNVVRLDRLRKTTAERTVEPYGLTTQELEVVRLVARGYTNREIAEMRRYSQDAIKHALMRAFPKMGVRNRVEAAVKWVREQEQRAA